MRFTILAVGKLKEPWARDGCLDYAGRLRKRLPLDVVEVRDDEELVRKVPARHPTRQKLWALDEHGRQFSSAELAAALGQLMDAGESGVTFVVGGADGLPQGILDRAHLVWSLGRLTLPHRLARLILLEQLYRAVGILRGEPYHRA